VQEGDRESIEHELGDMLFALVNLSRFVNVNPETALGKAISRFVQRFRYIERTILDSGRTLEDSEIQEMESLWQQAKAKL